MKVFQITEDEWWYGETLEAVFAAAENDTGFTRAELEKEFAPRELTEAEMDKPDLVIMSEEDEPARFGSYRDALTEIAPPAGTAGLLCCQE